MTTIVVRRLYVYTAAFIGLQMLAAGARGLLRGLLESLIESPAITSIEPTTARASLDIALVIVGLVLWLTHWRWAQRSLRATAERDSALRRFYEYLVLLIAMLSLLFATRELLEILFGPRDDGLAGAPAAPVAAAVVSGAIWIYHWRVFSADRWNVERTGAPATLRRWYLVIVQGVSLGVASFAAVALLDQLLQEAIQPALGAGTGLAWPVAALIAALAVWLPHHRWGHALVRRESPLRPDESRSTLRQVYAALVVTAAAVAALGGLTTLLYGVLLAGLGSATWRSLVDDYTASVATVVVAVPIWSYHRAQLAEEARLSKLATRGATARRINSYLTAAIGLTALFFGLGGLFSTLLRLLLAPDTLGGGWQESLSFNLALTMVALPVYVVVARSIEWWTRGAPDEERTLSRRIYLYAALLFGIVATIVAVVSLVRLVLDAALGAAPPDLGAQIGRWLGYAAVGAAITAYHGLLLRRAGAPRADAGRGLTVAIVADEPLLDAVANAVERDFPAATVHSLAPDALSRAHEIQVADVVIASLGAAFDSPLAGTIRGFTGRRLILAAPAPGIELVGATQNVDMLARDVTHRLRELAGTPAQAATPQTALPPGSA